MQVAGYKVLLCRQLALVPVFGNRRAVVSVPSSEIIAVSLLAYVQTFSGHCTVTQNTPIGYDPQ